MREAAPHSLSIVCRASSSPPRFQAQSPFSRGQTRPPGATDDVATTAAGNRTAFEPPRGGLGRRFSWLLGAAVALGGCGASATGPSSALGPDQPVPPSEPRADVALGLDLEPARDCEERFDLALYANRAIELVAWDEHHERCEKRSVVIRYLSRKISADDVRAEARAHALRAEPLPLPPAPSAAVAPPP